MIGQNRWNRPVGGPSSVGLKVIINDTNKMTTDIKNMYNKNENKLIMYDVNKMDKIMLGNAKITRSSNRTLKSKAPSQEASTQKVTTIQSQQVNERKIEIKSPIKSERTIKQIKQSCNPHQGKQLPSSNSQTATREVKLTLPFLKPRVTYPTKPKKDITKPQRGNKDINKTVSTIKFQTAIKDIQQRTAIRTQTPNKETEIRKIALKSTRPKDEVKQNKTAINFQTENQEINKSKLGIMPQNANQENNQRKYSARVSNSAERTHKSVNVIKSRTTKVEISGGEDISKVQNKEETNHTKNAINSQAAKKGINQSLVFANDEDASQTENSKKFQTAKSKINQKKRITKTPVDEKDVIQEKSTEFFQTSDDESKEIKRKHEDIISFGRTNRLRLEKLKMDFNRKKNKSLIMDSKVPEYIRHSWWYSHMITFKRSDKVKVLQEIEEYINLYKGIENISSLTFENLEEIQSTLKIAVERSKDKIMSSDSSTVFDICVEFVSSQIVDKIEKFKCDVAIHEYKMLRNKLKEVVEKEVNKYSQEFRKERDKHKEEIKREAMENERKMNFYFKMIQEYNSRLNALEN